jgi:hypothetical protein
VLPGSEVDEEDRPLSGQATESDMASSITSPELEVTLLPAVYVAMCYGF